MREKDIYMYYKSGNIAFLKEEAAFEIPKTNGTNGITPDNAFLNAVSGEKLRVLTNSYPDSTYYPEDVFTSETTNPFSDGSHVWNTQKREIIEKFKIEKTSTTIGFLPVGSLQDKSSVSFARERNLTLISSGYKHETVIAAVMGVPVLYRLSDEKKKILLENEDGAEILKNEFKRKIIGLKNNHKNENEYEK
ncbi:MAG: hypothetical protein AAB407_03635 [Patescibacteria group bacterium]